MNDVALSAFQTRYSLVGFLRNPCAIVFTIVMPLFLLVILNTIFHHLTDFIGAKSAALYYTPAMVGYQIVWAGLSSLNATVVADREAGLLKRFRGTPMPSWVYLTAEIARTVVVVVCTVFVLVLVGVVFYRIRLSGDAILGLAVYTVLGAAVMSALGLAFDAGLFDHGRLCGSRAVSRRDPVVHLRSLRADESHARLARRSRARLSPRALGGRASECVHDGALQRAHGAERGSSRGSGASSESSSPCARSGGSQSGDVERLALPQGTGDTEFPAQSIDSFRSRPRHGFLVTSRRGRPLSSGIRGSPLAERRWDRIRWRTRAR